MTNLVFAKKEIAVHDEKMQGRDPSESRLFAEHGPNKEVNDK
jgi:hypothetical protein